METRPSVRPALPLTRDLSPCYAASLAIAIIMAAASVAGLAGGARVYPDDALVRAFVPNDVANLCIGLPILLASMWLAWRGRLVGLLCWPGALFYVLYNYLVYVHAMPLNAAFVAHLALVTLSIYTLIALVASIDGHAVQSRLQGAVPERLAGAVLVTLGVLFLAQAGGSLMTALTAQAGMPDSDMALHSADAVISPALIIGGVLLWRKQALGYVAGLGLLFQTTMLFVALILFLVLQPVLTSAAFRPADVLVIATMGLVPIAPLVLYARGATACC